MKNAFFLILFGVLIGGLVVGGICSSVITRNESQAVATVGQLREEIRGLKTIAGNLGRLNRGLEERVKSSSGRVERSVVYVDRLREISVGVGKQIDDSLDDVGFIRATIEGLPVLGVD